MGDWVTPLMLAGGSTPSSIEHGRNHVDGVGVLCANLAFGLDGVGPVHDEGIADAAAIGLAFPAAEGRVARPSPAPGIVIEVIGSTQFIDSSQVCFERVGHIVEKEIFVDRAGGSALRTGAIVRDHHNQRVLELVDLLEEVEQAADVVVCVLQEPGEDFHHAGVELALLRRTLVPRLAHRGRGVRVRHRRDNAQLFLAGKGLFAIGFPTVIELPCVSIGPFFGYMMRRVHGPGAEIHKEGLVRGDLLGIGNEADGFVGQVFSDVIAFLGRFRRLDLVIVVDQFGIILVGFATEEAVETLETSAQRPAVVRTRRRNLVGWRQMPLADGVGVVAMLEKHLRQETVLERNIAIATGIAG